jgi:predicted transcriptional regulator
MRKRVIRLHISNTEDVGQRFVKAWKTAEGKSGDVADENHLSFIGLKAYLSTLTAKRWDLLKVLNKEGPRSIRALSKLLDRDYKSVHGDVGKLMELGLIVKRDDGLIEAPYDRIISDVRMAAA